jgi:hypothetical protein
MVSLLVVDCSASPPPFVDILGQGLIADPSKLNLHDDTRSGYCTFTISIATPYQIRLTNINPPINIGVYTVEYGERKLFTGVLECPIGMSGIYFIDQSRKAMRDTYNEVIKKIPDPTIRTALIGE